MDVGYEGLDWQVDEYSRARAATSLAATVQSRMARASVARVMERAMVQELWKVRKKFNRPTNSGILSAIAQRYIFL